MKTIEQLSESVHHAIRTKQKSRSPHIKKLKSEIKWSQTMANLNCCNVLLAIIHCRHGRLPTESQMERKIRRSVKVNNSVI